MATAQQGQKVKIHYTGKLENGDVFDTSEGKQPLEFVIGQGHIIKGFEEGVIGMAIGEEKDLVIPPEKGYGTPRPELIQEVPKDKLGELKPEIGMTIGMQVPGIEQVIPATITEVKEDGITVDLNPPLAGKTLHFHIKIESIEEAAPAQAPTSPDEPPAAQAPESKQEREPTQPPADEPQDKQG